MYLQFHRYFLQTVECPLETNLNVDDLARLSGAISCEHPTVDLYQFYGNISLSLTQGQDDPDSLYPYTNKVTIKYYIFLECHKS